MEIKGYLKTSLIEWPGKISSVIFVPGCNFRCPFCHNSHLVDPKKIAKLSEISEKETLADLKKRRKWIDGIVITGGEPTLEPDLPAFLKKLKKLGFETMIETNGSKPEVISNLVISNLVNYIAIDFKGPLNERYAKTAGLESFDPKIWIESLKIILKSGIPFELRTTAVPGIHDEKVLLAMAKQLKSIVQSSKLKVKSLPWVLQNFQPKNCLDPKFKKIKPFSKLELEEFLKTKLLKCSIIIPNGFARSPD